MINPAKIRKFYTRSKLFGVFFAATRETYYSHSLVKLARNSDYSLVKLAKNSDYSLIKLAKHLEVCPEKCRLIY